VNQNGKPQRVAMHVRMGDTVKVRRRRWQYWPPHCWRVLAAMQAGCVAVWTAAGGRAGSRLPTCGPPRLAGAALGSARRAGGHVAAAASGSHGGDQGGAGPGAKRAARSSEQISKNWQPALATKLFRAGLPADSATKHALPLPLTCCWCR
jgi:alkylation response protein AidB-like acyl-CoA dehydrogenase